MNESQNKQIVGLRGVCALLLHISLSYTCCVQFIFHIKLGTQDSPLSVFNLISTLLFGKFLFYDGVLMTNGIIQSQQLRQIYQGSGSDLIFLLIRHYFLSVAPVWVASIIMLSIPSMIADGIKWKEFVAVLFNVHVFVEQLGDHSGPLFIFSLQFASIVEFMVLLYLEYNFKMNLTKSIKIAKNFLYLSQLFIEFLCADDEIGYKGKQNRHYLYYAIAFLNGSQIAEKLFPFKIVDNQIRNVPDTPKYSIVQSYIFRQCEQGVVVGDVLFLVIVIITVVVFCFTVGFDIKVFGLDEKENLSILLLWLGKVFISESLSLLLTILLTDRTVVVKKLLSSAILQQFGSEFQFTSAICLVTFWIILYSVESIEIGPFSEIPMLIFMTAVTTFEILSGHVMAQIFQPITAKVDAFILQKFDQQKLRGNAERIRNKLQNRL